jgi:hypothetical protein
MARKKLPKSATEARKRGYSKIVVRHSKAEKRKWAWVKHRGKWAFTPAESAMPQGPHTVCYFDPNTGFYDDCHESG